jgi:hypothetical protein
MVAINEAADELITESDIAMLQSQLLGALTEAAGETDGSWRQIAGVRQPATYSGGNTAYLKPYTTLWDRMDGRYLPFYQTEWDLQAIRGKARNLATFTSIAVGAVEALQVYTIGGQWKFESVAKEDVTGVSDKLLAAVQKVIDEAIDDNDFLGTYDESIHSTSRIDGECLTAVYGYAGGKSKIRKLDADCLREPQNAKSIERGLSGVGYSLRGPQSWSFGVHTAFDPTMNRVDHATPLGYHVVFEETGKEWDYLPAFPQANAGRLSNKCLVHLKLNVPPDAKRGVSDFYPIQDVLERKHILGRNLAVGAAIQSAIAYIREHVGGTATRAQVVSQLSTALDTFSKAAAANRNDGKMQQNFSPGTVIDTSASAKYHAGPLGELKSAVFIEVCAYLMRCIGIRWLMPEYMISGDASNANFASTLVSESPFVRARESDQRKFVNNTKRILWSAIKIAFDAGRFTGMVGSWQQLRACVELRVKAPQVASRDKAQLLEESITLYRERLISANDVLTDMNRESRPGWDDRWADKAELPDAAAAAGIGQAGVIKKVQESGVAAKVESLGERVLAKLME